MSAIATFVEQQREVCPGVFEERAQELDVVVSRYLPVFYKRAFRFLGTQRMRKMPSRMLSFPLTSIRPVQRASPPFNLVNNNCYQRCEDAITSAPRQLLVARRRARGRRSHIRGTVT
jgi:hypothetical protein